MSTRGYFQHYHRLAPTIVVAVVTGAALSGAGFLVAGGWEERYSRANFAFQSENRVSVIRREIVPIPAGSVAPEWDWRSARNWSNCWVERWSETVLEQGSVFWFTLPLPVAVTASIIRSEPNSTPGLRRFRWCECRGAKATARYANCGRNSGRYCDFTPPTADRMSSVRYRVSAPLQPEPSRYTPLGDASNSRCRFDLSRDLHSSGTHRDGEGI